ncbi:hypothetical protein BDZ90DRAFT_228583 [Jaminaea rosea]|uniref:Uncharacterized protein n=1 Tax=Jaminaea rosea TaxID=1569628 RepID=A0A316UHX6_9BASI|nr:hypothetical protein BDZ90DRAFT_228583 [Jaminaea rosea]PWN24872.1 hypothetical protein BDZ90DRAFT_228583 [Jaminaea rosea]
MLSTPSLLISLLLLLLSHAASHSNAAQVKLGWCYAMKHCNALGGYKQVNGDSQAIDQPLFTNYPNCASFLAAPDPPVKLNVCQGLQPQSTDILVLLTQSETCVQACDAAHTSGTCVSVPDNAAPGAAYNIISEAAHRYQSEATY